MLVILLLYFAKQQLRENQPPLRVASYIRSIRSDFPNFPFSVYICKSDSCTTFCTPLSKTRIDIWQI
jgi:hypothetical protein